MTITQGDHSSVTKREEAELRGRENGREGRKVMEGRRGKERRIGVLDEVRKV